MKQKQSYPAPTILTELDAVPTHRGRCFITAAFPSSRDGVPAHPITVDLSGAVIDHQCPAAEANRQCWHVSSAAVEAVIAAWWAVVWADATDDALARHAADLLRYVTVCGERDDRYAVNAALLELEAVTGLLARREGVAA